MATVTTSTKQRGGVISNPLSSTTSKTLLLRKKKQRSAFALVICFILIMLLLFGIVLIVTSRFSNVESNGNSNSNNDSNNNNTSALGNSDNNIIINNVNKNNTNNLLRNQNKKQPEEQQQQQKVMRRTNYKDFVPYPDSIASKKEYLLLQTSIGTIRILLRPDLSNESISYIHNIISMGCTRCNLYRAEKPGILQGIIANKKHVPVLNEITDRGKCPIGYENVPNDCPEWDENCNCHGPVMIQGSVAWAAGVTGPDFFINNYKQPALWWGTQHTVWGQITDDSDDDYNNTTTSSFEVLNRIFAEIPTHEEGGLTMMNEPIHFDLSIHTR